MSSNPSGLCNLNGTLFFAAQDETNGIELWKSDGTPGGTVMVKDIKEGPNGSAPFRLFAMGNHVFFTADNGISGYELWKSDGTENGTALVKNIKPGIEGSLPGNFIIFKEKLYFTAIGDQGNELWKSDGSLFGTYMVRDINFGPGSSTPTEFTIFNNELFFSASGINAIGGVPDRELWKTDGTLDGTVLVKNIHPNISSNPTDLCVFNNALFFVAYSENQGIEIFKSNGKAAGTSTIPKFDIVPGLNSSSPRNLTVMNGNLFFSAKTSSGRELWKISQTDIANQVADIYEGPNDSDPRMFSVVGTKLLFVANNGIKGRELWKSDGTGVGTVLVQDLVVGIEPAEIVEVNGQLCVRGTDLYFISNGPDGFELRRSNGTVNGVVNIRDIGIMGSNPTEFTKMGNLTFFAADDGKKGRELWKTDGTLAGTERVADILPDTAGSSPSNLTVITAANGEQTLFFVAKDPTKGRELFKLENLPNAVPTRLSDILVGPIHSNIGNLTNVNGTLFFTASQTVLDGGDLRIFKVNAARSGVEAPGGDMSYVDNLAALGGTLFFTQKPPNGGPSLYKLVNGVTTLIDQFGMPPITQNTNIQQLKVVGTTLFFTVTKAQVSKELWKLESTLNAEPLRIFEIVANGAISEISNMTNFNGVLHFTAFIAGNSRIYKTNNARTAVLTTGGNMQNANNLMPAGTKLFFTQSPTDEGPQLSMLENGTTKVLKTFDLMPDGQSTIPKNLTTAGGKVFFTAADTANGRELWQSDGTVLGTKRISNIRTGVGNANILEIKLAGQDLYLSANDQTVGQEPWLLANVVLLQGGGSEERDAALKIIEMPTLPLPEIKVYPNPAANFVNVDLPESEMTGTLSILSASGQLVRSVQSSEGESSIQLDIQDLQKGVYMVRWVQSDGQVVVTKLMVQ